MSQLIHIPSTTTATRLTRKSNKPLMLLLRCDYYSKYGTYIRNWSKISTPASLVCSKNAVRICMTGCKTSAMYLMNTRGDLLPRHIMSHMIPRVDQNVCC